jgi:hypothetical protein
MGMGVRAEESNRLRWSKAEAVVGTRWREECVDNEAEHEGKGPWVDIFGCRMS